MFCQMAMFYDIFVYISFAGHNILFILLWMMQILTLKKCRMCSSSCSSPDFETSANFHSCSCISQWKYLGCHEFPWCTVCFLSSFCNCSVVHLLPKYPSCNLLSSWVCDLCAHDLRYMGTNSGFYGVLLVYFGKF